MKGKLSEYGVLVGEEHQQGRRNKSVESLEAGDSPSIEMTK